MPVPQRLFRHSIFTHRPSHDSLIVGMVVPQNGHGFQVVVVAMLTIHPARITDISPAAPSHPDPAHPGAL